jgi:lactose/cellobiose-specific phosphotransferase system IIC component
MTAIRESFIAMVPFLFLTSSILLSLQGLKYFKINLFFIDFHSYQNVYLNIYKLFIPLIVFSISFHVSRRFNINTFITVVSSLIVLVSYETLLNSNQYSLTIHTLIIPIFSAYFFRFYGKYFIYNSKYLAIVTQVSISFKYVLPFFINYVLLLSLLLVLSNDIFTNTVDIKAALSNLPIDIFIALKIMWIHILWFFGIHGSDVSSLLFDPSIFQTLHKSNITHSVVYNMFIVYGGAGAGLSLAIAILIYRKNKQWNKVVKLSFPFLIFNINEILIYGLPIILNRYLLIPFIIVPLFNFVFIYTFLFFELIEFVDVPINWITPVFINAFYITDGSILAIAVQFVMVSMGVLIYYPFIRMYSKSQSVNIQEENLSSNLNLKYVLNSKEGINSSTVHQEVVKNNNYINTTIDRIANNNLELHYQPKVNIKDNSCTRFEALLRINGKDGIEGPYFIEEFNSAGLGLVIDYWVCTQVKKDLMYLKEKYGFSPKISINLFPNTLNDNDTILKICDLFAEEIIEFEILESTEFNLTETSDNINLLLSKGFTFAIDDFGTGYSNIQTLYNTAANIIKIDKSLVDNLGDEKANIILFSLCDLCKKLDYQILLEGIETQKQFDIVKDLNIDFIQGFYFSKSIPRDDLFKFSQSILKT